MPKIYKKICKGCKKYNEGYGKYFCSNKCQHLFNGPENNPFWKGGKVKLVCLICEKNFEVHPSRIGKSKTCSKKCSSKRISIEKTGSNHWNWKGGARCVDCQSKISGYEFKRCTSCFHKTHRNSSHWNWKGGITTLYAKVRHCNEYKSWRKEIYRRDYYTCQICRNKRSYKLNINADHYPISFARILKQNLIDTFEKALKCKLLWDTNNGRTLCVPCHKQTDTYGYYLV